MSYPRQDDYEQFLDEFHEEVNRRYEESLQTAGASEGESVYYVRRLSETLFHRLVNWVADRYTDGDPGLTTLARSLEEAEPAGPRWYRVIIPEVAHNWLQDHREEVCHALDPENRKSYLKFTRAFVA